MRNSKWLLLLVLQALGGITRADQLSLAGDARLTGTIRSINEAGVVELSSVLSSEPLLLKAGAVSKVEFSTPESSPNLPTTLIELANGDLLPATVESLDDKFLVAVTESAGRLTIPRAALKSMQLGVRKRKAIYSGPRSAQEWHQGQDDSKRWKFADDGLLATGPAVAARTFDTPSQFILKFTLKWQANPNFQISFADPLASSNEAVDRYYLQFNGAGLEIKREASKGKRFQTVILLARTPDQFPENQVAVEIRVDRKSSRIHLLLNGEPEGAGIDPVADPPSGRGVTLVNSASAGLSQEIRAIELLELDNARARHRAENRGDATTDSLISRDEDRWSGRLIRIAKGPQDAQFSFKSDFQDEPLELSEADVSTIFFGHPEPDAASQNEHSFALRLPGEGSLRVSSCTFSATSIHARHPLLGLLEINRSGVLAMERLDSQPEVKAAE